jgi:SAM-dependent methyltransferase
MDTLKQRYERTMRAWDECASTYERQIVCGHPDIHAFECFEEDLLDRLIEHLVTSQPRRLKLLDIGCGSGRLHMRYGARALPDASLTDEHPLRMLRHHRPELAHDPVHQMGVDEVWGVDFSANMIDLAAAKIEQGGLASLSPVALTLHRGSAFELSPHADDRLPLAVCLVNSIGVMQGHEGGRELFRSLRRCVEEAGGIAIISCFQREYLATYGLGQYESTLDVSGQPVWMRPDTYAGEGYTQVPRAYKRHHSEDPGLVVDVYDAEGAPVAQGHELERDPERTAETLSTGRIRTHSDYESNWYSFDELDAWIDELWPEGSLHVRTRELDALRAEPAQMAILDATGLVAPLLGRWGLEV